MSTRRGSIEALLARAWEQLTSVEAAYNDALATQNIPNSLRVDIKNLCENLRSVLDYLAADLRERHCSTATSADRFYFPILPDETQFRARMQQWFPDLESSCKPAWDYLESVQPYKSLKNIWLGQFNTINNTNKHGDLVQQTRSEVKEVRVTTAGGGRISWAGNVKFSGRVWVAGVPVDPATQLPVPHPSQKVEQILWVDFRFRDIDVPALALLKSALEGVERIARDAMAFL